MFFIEPFIWMFSVKNFKHHFVYLLLMAAICWGIVYALFMINGSNFFATPNLYLNIAIVIAEIALFLAPILCLTGYYWCLTDNIIGRDLEAKLDSVYNGRSPDLKNVISLPEWDVPRFIWRGIASIFATFIMYIPFTLLMMLIVFNLSLYASFYNLDPMRVIVAVGIVMLLVSLMIPGLLWNYARRDSVVAVLNLPKAIYLMESYPLKYFLNTFLIVVFSIARSFIMRAIVVALGFGALLTTAKAPCNYMQILDSGLLAMYGILIVIGYIIDSYWVFVNSYLLGTIAPPSEY